jgi:Flp pilus assembly CpaF family ATPase
MTLTTGRGPAESDLRQAVLDAWAQLAAEHESSGSRPPSDADKRMLAKATVRREIDAWAAAAQQAGRRVLSGEEEQRLTERVVASVFAVIPGTEEFLGRDDITNVMVVGNDSVRAQLTNGGWVTFSPMVERDEDLIEVLQTAARRAGHIEREFSETRPMLELQLRDGSRLAGAAWVTPRPYLTIRRHPLATTGHDELVARGMYDEGTRSLLSAMVRARWNGIICGAPNVGKTTLLRALMHDVVPGEWPVTLESDPELRLDELLPHLNFRAFYERIANSEGQGELDLTELSKRLKRHNPTRTIVGEVRGAEAITMLEAMSAGADGGWTTMHANAAAAVFPRLYTYTARAEGNWTREHVYELAAQALDVIVFLRQLSDGRRVIAEICHVESYAPSTSQMVIGEWFVPGPAGTAVPNPQSPIPLHLLDELRAYGYDPRLHRPSPLAVYA